MTNNLFKSNDLMSLFGITRNTLRFYEKKGLLKPFSVDPATGYRYYGLPEFEKLHRILLYKKSGMKLCEIKEYLEGQITAGELEKVLCERLESIQHGIEIVHSHMAGGETHAVERVALPQRACVVKTFVLNGSRSLEAEFYDYLIAKREKTAAPLRGKLPDFIELLEDSRIYGNGASDSRKINLCMYADQDNPPAGAVIYPATEAVTASSVGGDGAMKRVYEELTDYMTGNNLVQNGHVRATFLLGPFAVKQERFVTRVIIPVKSSWEV